MLLIPAAMGATFSLLEFPVDRSGTRDIRWPWSGLINHAIEIHEQFADLSLKCGRARKDVAC